MTISKRDLEKRLREFKAKVAAIEAKCQGGSGTREDYEELTRLRRKMK